MDLKTHKTTREDKREDNVHLHVPEAVDTQHHLPLCGEQDIRLSVNL